MMLLLHAMSVVYAHNYLFPIYYKLPQKFKLVTQYFHQKDQDNQIQTTHTSYS